jgi:protein O-mannosyl-transferase
MGPDADGRTIRRAAPYLLLLVAAVLPYLHTLDGPLIWDDEFLLAENRAIRSLDKAPYLFSLSHWVKEYSGTPGQYRPLRSLTFALSYALWGLEPMGYRLTNLLLYVFTVWMVYALARRLLKDDLAALMAGVLFAVHPAHTEAVAWIKNRTEIMAALFVLAGMWGFWKYEEGRRWGWGISLLAGPLAMLSKEGAVVFPALLGAWILHSRPREQWWRGLRGILPHVAVLLGWTAFMFLILGKRVSAKPPPELTTIHHLNVVLGTAWVYLRDLFFPAYLNAEHALPSAEGFADLLPWVTIAALLGLGALWNRLRRIHPASAFSLVWMGVALLPVLNIRFITGRPIADQRVFLASVGACWLLGHAAAWLVRGRYPGLTPAEYRMGAWSLVGVVVVASALASYQRNHVWIDPVVLYEDTIRKSPRAERAHFNLGNMYKGRGEWENAVRAYRQAIAINPAFEGSYNNLGLAYYNMGDYDRAEQEYMIGLRIRPDSIALLMNLGILYKAMGRHHRAMEQFQRIVDLDPDRADAYVHVGDVHAVMGHWGEAEIAFRQALSLSPDNREARDQLAQVRRIRGQWQREAMEDSRKAIETDPSNPEGWLQLGDVLADKGEIQRAMETYDRAIALNPQDPRGRLRKGLLLEANGDADGARREYQGLTGLEQGGASGNLRLGALLVKEGRLKEAEGVLRKALDARPDDAETHLQLAWIYLDREDAVSQAMDHLREALRVAPLHPRREEIRGVVKLLEEQQRGLASGPRPGR